MVKQAKKIAACRKTMAKEYLSPTASSCLNFRLYEERRTVPMRVEMNHGCKSALRWMAVAATAGVLLAGAPLRAQDQEPSSAPGARGGRGQFAGMQRVSGEVTAVAGANVTLKSEDGSAVTVVTTENTRVMKGRGNTVKVGDIKPGDGLMAAGNMDAPNKTLHAALVFVVDAAQVKAERESFGKTHISGRVTAIDADNAKMTIERPDHVSQTIGFDETTSFRRGRMGRMGGMGFGGGGAAAGAGAPAADAGESITLADIKVGDMVAGPGAVKGGTFVPTQLTVMTPGQGRRRGGEGAGASGAGGANAGAPAGPQN